MEFVPVIMLLLLIKKAVDWLRYLAAGDVNGIVTQLVTWAGGVGAVVLVAQTDWAASIAVDGTNLGALNFWSLLFVGLTIGSGASVVHDTTKAIDGSDSAKIPPLVDKSE